MPSAIVVVCLSTQVTAAHRTQKSMVVLGFTPTTRGYCHAVLSTLATGSFDRVILEAPLVGDLLGEYL
jgi:hypothetical protein